MIRWLLPLLLAGCPGSVEPTKADQPWIPLLDFSRPADLDSGPSDVTAPDGPLGAPDSQGTSCTSSSISFVVSGALAACGTVAVTVTGPSALSWVMVGVTSQAGTTKWSAGASASCPSGCSWTFPKVSLPCEAGPYSLSFMRDATNDDPALGVIVATCTP